MRDKVPFLAVFALTIVSVLLPCMPARAADSERAIYSFNGVSLTPPSSPLAIDASGNLYGASLFSTANPNGAIFKLAKGTNGRWVMTMLYAFANPVGGRDPEGNLILDSAGNLYGTTTYNGKSPNECCGEVFELTPTASGQWSKTTVYALLGGNQGAFPAGGMIFDAAGNLYGTTWAGGQYGYGTVFELSPNPGGGWTETTLYAFQGGSDGRDDYAGLIFDKKGNLYGETSGGGVVSSVCPLGCGTIFELTPTSSGWTEKVLYAFTGGSDGGGTSGNLVIDGSGNLYATADFGGDLTTCGGSGCGAIVELSPRGGTWTESVLHNFNGGSDGALPYGTLNINWAGHLFGTTVEGGSSCNCGTIFELSPNSGGGWTESILYEFSGGSNGAYPESGLSVDKKGSFFGVAYEGGIYNTGTVFQFIP